MATAPTPNIVHGWGGRVLFVGPGRALTPHRNAVAVLALGLTGPFGVAHDPLRLGCGYRTCRSALIAPNTLAHIAHHPSRMAFLYVDARSRDLRRVAADMADPTPSGGFDLREEAAIIDLLSDLASGVAGWRAVRSRLESWLGATPRAAFDPRVVAALDILHADPAARVSLDELAERVGLSASRLRHLFVAATGVPLRRYRIWIAMGAATRAVRRGASLTAAAHEAGFASSAHFSTAFREMFGSEPSAIFRPGPVASEGSSTD